MLAAKWFLHDYRKSRKNYLGDLARNMEWGFERFADRCLNGQTEWVLTHRLSHKFKVEAALGACLLDHFGEILDGRVVQFAPSTVIRQSVRSLYAVVDGGHDEVISTAGD